jgi:CRP-like cAMP-binding protein
MNAEDTLSKVPLFRQLKPKQVKSLARWTTTRSWGPGETIVSQGQMGMGLYCIQTGRVKVTQHSTHGERDVREMEAGEAFGELSLLSDQPRSATVTAVEPTTAVMLDKSQFLAEMHSHPEMALDLIPVLVAWLQDADRRLSELS